ncbi:hypothetical protein D3C84_326150 [compost metagenome]
MVHAHAAGALDQRLDDHRGDLAVMLGQGLLHVGEHGPRMLLPADPFGAVVAVRAGHLEGVQQQRLVGVGEQRHVAHRHGRDGFAVIAVGQGDEALLALVAAVAPVVEAHLQRHLDARGAVVGVEHPVEPRRGDRHQALGQLDHRLMAEAGEHHVLELVDLGLDAGADARIGVAEHVDPPGADRIEVALAVEVLQPDAFAAADRDQRQLLVILHLRAGVPEHGKVALHPLLVAAHRRRSSGGVGLGAQCSRWRPALGSPGRVPTLRGRLVSLLNNQHFEFLSPRISALNRWVCC